MPFIRRRSNYIIGFIAPAIGPNKSKKVSHYTWQSLNKKQYTWLHRQPVIICEAMYVVFHLDFAAYIVNSRYDPCEFPGFVWTDCWGNKSFYVITSPANRMNPQSRGLQQN